MINLAIVIGISKYEKEFQNLPQCKKDAEVIKNILTISKKYKEILYISDKTYSGIIFNKIDEFLNKYKDVKINEILYYFSGHGISKKEEFYCCTTNTKEDSINSSSLKNSDIDLRIKSMKPSLYTKIIDACESGTMYIKGKKNINLIKSPANSSNNMSCYFFNSSLTSQESKVLNSMSCFTLSIINILKKSYIDEKQDSIKYRDLSNKLSDEYQTNETQTPFFVQQGDLSEIFLDINEKMIDYINDNIDDEEKPEQEEAIDLISMDEDRAILFKNNLLTTLENKLKRNTALLKKYNYKITKEDSSDNIIPRDKICNWIIANRDKYFIFARHKTRKVLKSGKMFSILNNEEDYDFITDDFSVNVDKENYEISFTYKSLNNGFPRLKCQIICIYSLTKLYFIYTYGYSIPESWTSYSQYEQSTSVSIKVIGFNSPTTIVNMQIKEISDEFKKYADDYINNYIDAIM